VPTTVIGASSFSLKELQDQIGSELHPLNVAAQTRMVSVTRIRLDFWESERPFKGIICDDISEFESYHLSHAVRSLSGGRGVRKPRVRLERPQIERALWVGYVCTMAGRAVLRKDVGAAFNRLAIIDLGQLDVSCAAKEMTVLA
jgi:hypothetical protein